MPRLESAGYHIVLHIHDEISAEVPLDFGTAEEFLQILTTPPSWADGLPIAAKVYRITQAVGGADPQTGLDIVTSCVVWEEAVDMTADQAIAAAAPPRIRACRAAPWGFCLTS